ncbi:MAG: hypothetical protein ACLPTZ_20300 [Beijerinckiaceae bacterium]
MITKINAQNPPGREKTSIGLMGRRLFNRCFRVWQVRREDRLCWYFGSNGGSRLVGALTQIESQSRQHPF